MNHHGAAEVNGQKSTLYWELGTYSWGERRNIHMKCRPGRTYWEWDRHHMEAAFTASMAALEAVQGRAAVSVVYYKDCNIILSGWQD